MRVKNWSLSCERIANEIPFNRPTHLKIESVVRNTVHHSTITGLHPHSTVTHLTFTNILHHGGLQDIFPSLEHLVIKFTNFAKVGKIRYFEPPLHIKSLHLHYNGCYDIGPAGSTILLPNLQELGLTLPQINLAKRLDLPSKLRLILYANTTKKLMKPSWESYTKLFGSITHVIFKGWRAHKPPTPNNTWGATTVLHDNLRVFNRLDSITFIDSFVDGTSLMKLVDRNNGRETSAVSLTLKEITIDGFNGITRSDCEEILQHVEKLRVIL